MMLGWSVLLLWAYRRPLERRFVAALTVLVIPGLILTEVVAVHSRALEAWRIASASLLAAVGAPPLQAADGGRVEGAVRPRVRGVSLVQEPVP